MPLHTDRATGQGLLSIYPSIFSGFIFALSCVVASAMIEDIHVAHPGANRLPLAGIGPLVAMALLATPANLLRVNFAVMA